MITITKTYEVSCCDKCPNHKKFNDMGLVSHFCDELPEVKGNFWAQEIRDYRRDEDFPKSCPYLQKNCNVTPIVHND